MKYNYIISALVAATMVVGCSEETFLPENNFGKGEKMVVGAALDQSTRLAFSEEENGDVTLTWTADDYLSLIDPVNQQVTPFNLTNGEGTATGRFEGTPAQPYTNNQQVLALFSKNPDAPVTINKERNGVYIDLSGQDGTLNEKYQYMFGGTKYSEERDLNFSLSPLVSVIKATFTLPADVSEVSSIYFKDLNNCYRSNAFVMLQDGSFGEYEYNAGELIRIDRELNSNLEGERYQISEGDPYDGDVMIERTFIPDGNNSITAYFYVMSTSSLEVNHDLGANYDEFEHYTSRWFGPMFLLNDQSGNSYIFKAESDKEINPGYVYDLCLYQPNDIIDLSVGQEADFEYGSFYSFTPTVTGKYLLNLVGTNYFYEINDQIVGKNQPVNGLFEAGKSYVYASSFDRRAVISCTEKFQSVNLNEEFIFNSSNRDDSNVYLFTPTESGLYSLEGMPNGFHLNDFISGEYIRDIDSNYYLEKNKTYRFDYWSEEPQSFEVRWVKCNSELFTLTVGENTRPMPVPTAENEKYGMFVLQSSYGDIYKISGLRNASVRNHEWYTQYDDDLYIKAGVSSLIIQSNLWREVYEGETFTYHITVEKIDPTDIPINTNVQLQGGKNYSFIVPETGFYLYEGNEIVIDLCSSTPIFYDYEGGFHWLIANQNGSVRFSKKTVDGTIEVGEETTVKANKLYEIVGFGDSFYKPVLSESLEGTLYDISNYGYGSTDSWNNVQWFDSNERHYFIPRTDGKITIEKVNY